MPVIQCFLCEREFEDTPASDIDKVYIAQTGDHVHVCRTCFVVICNGDDQTLCRMYIGKRESESAGYTDRGAVELLEGALLTLGWRLYVGVTPARDVAVAPASARYTPETCLVAVSRHPGNNDLRIYCRINKPLPAGLARAALYHLPQLRFDGFVTWVDHWLIALPPSEGGAVLTLNSHIHATVWEAYLKSTGGVAPDPFKGVAASGLLVGYELIRRWLL